MTRKLFALFLCAVLLISLFAGCNQSGGGESTTAAPVTTTKATTKAPAKTTATTAAPEPELYYNEPGTLPIVKEPIVLNCGVPASITIEDWETNEYTLFLEEQTGIDLQFQTFPSDEFATKIDLMMAAGGDDLPEVIFGTNFKSSSLANWGGAGHILALNDYYDTLAYNLPIALDACTGIDFETALSLVRSVDGSVYGMISYAEQKNDMVSGNRIVTYKPWLEKLNMEKPETLDELHAYLTAVRDQDMNGNGDLNDEIPLTGYKSGISILKNALVSPFTLNNGNDPWYIDDGEVKFNCNSEEYREGIRYIQSLLEEGLLDPFIFTQDQTQMNAIITGPEDVVGAFLRGSQTNISNADHRYVDFACFSYALAGPSGVRYNSYAPRTPNITYLISKTCEHPEAAFLLGDYMATEEASYINRYGFEGKDWFPVDLSKGEYISPYNSSIPRFNESNSLWGKSQNIWWGNLGVSVLSVKLMEATSIPNDPEAVTTIHTQNAATSSMDQLQYTNPSCVFGTMVYSAEEDAVIQDVWTAINTYIGECFARFCLGDLDIEKDWDSYCAEIEKMGLADVQAANQSAYDRMYK